MIGPIVELSIRFKPEGLTFDQFHALDVICFPEEPIDATTFETRMRGDFWAAYNADFLIGYGCISRKPDLFWITRLGVSPEHRGHGIGTNLLRAMLTHCNDEGSEGQLLYVQSDNEPAIRLYTNFGFTIVESAYQFRVENPTSLAGSRSSNEVEVVPIVDVDRSEWPHFPTEWNDLGSSHNPPKQYVMVFREFSKTIVGYCRLNPSFPGCFPFVMDRPTEHLASVLTSLIQYLPPETQHLVLTFSGKKIAEACRNAGMQLNYHLHKMTRETPIA